MRRNAAGPESVEEYGDWNDRQLGRMVVTRRGLLWGAAAGGCVLGGAAGVAAYANSRASFHAAGGTPAPSGIAISGRHLSWVSDGAGDPSTAIRATAQLSSPDGRLPGSIRAVLEIGTQPGQYGRRVPAEIVHLLGMYAIENGPVGSQFYVKAEVTGLQASTLYHYRFRLSDSTTSGDAFFTTAPARTSIGSARHAPAPFSFAALADLGTNRPPTDPSFALGSDPRTVRLAEGVWPQGTFDSRYLPDDPVAGRHPRDLTPALTQTRAIAAAMPAFTVLAGDICYADATGTGLPADNSGLLGAGIRPGRNAYNPYVWDVFLDQVESSAAYSPWMFATGNHDMEPLYGRTADQGDTSGDSPNHGYAGHGARLDLPRNGPRGCPSVYSFAYANVGVLCIDANDLSAEIQTNTGYSDGRQLAYLRQILERWRGDPIESAKVDFVVAFFHHCAFSTAGAHASDGGVRKALDPLFSRYQVDLAIQGHNHVFERTDPIRHGRRTRSAPDGSTIYPAADGVTYLTVGSGGRPRHRFRPGSPQGPAGALRYRGLTGGAGGPGENVRSSFVWSKDRTRMSPDGYRQGTKVDETVDWSQVRYDAYAHVMVDVRPATAGHPTTMTVRTLADAMPGSHSHHTEIDRIILSRRAGRGGRTVT